MDPTVPADSLRAHPLALPPGGPLAPGPGRRARDEARTGLYVHVPFCPTRCGYCDFASGRASGAAMDRYLDAIAVEAGLRAGDARGWRFSSVFFGGGTPSALSARHFRRLIATLRAHYDIAPDAEITLEANPESVRPALLDAWAQGGVNRLSLGAQSFEPDELERLGRLHGAERPGEALALARAHGIARLSLDLMFGFPGHTLERWQRTIETALALGTEHLSAYCFIPEPGTPLGNAALRGEAPLPAPEEQAEGYEWLTARCEAHGLACYETSNFCRAGAEARHNLVYWLRRPYLALGPSAHGFVNGERYANPYAFERWAGALERGALPETSREPESSDSIAQETMMLGLRLSGGLDPRDHDAAQRDALERRYGAAFDLAVASGRLERVGGTLRVPRSLRFVADDVLAWLEARAADELTAAASAS